MSDLDELLAKAEAALGADDPHRALITLREICRQPEFHKDLPRLTSVLEIFARISEHFASAEQVDTARAAARHDPEALYNLGSSLLGENLGDIALIAFLRVNDLVPREAVVIGGIAQALENLGQSRQACDTLRGVPELLDVDFFLRYLLAFNGIMAGDLADALQSMEMLGEPSDPDETAMAARVGDMLARANAIRDICALDGKDLRGWHYVLTGGILTHLSPYGFDDGMNGRYAFTQDSHARCKEGLLRLKAVLDAWGNTPDRIISAGDRGSSILAAAAAELFDLPLEPFGDPRRAGLIVAYDPMEVPDEFYGPLSECMPGQMLYCHAARWTEPAPYTPDIVTLLYQTNMAPWGERMQIDPESHGSETVPPDTRPAEEVAADILGATPDDEDMADIGDLARIAAAMKDKSAAFQSSGERSPIWYQGPVKSSRFL